MSTDTQNLPARRLEDVPIDLIDPDPQNRRKAPDAEFVASVREHGVLEPILVVPHPDREDRYLIVAGERRWRAAKRAKLATVPAVVRFDMDERARVEAQVSENLHRADLAPCEEAVQLMRLISLGHDIKTLAAAVGRSQGHVRKRLKLVELPAKAQRLIDDGEWSIDEGLVALKLIDHPEELNEIIADRPRNVGWAINRALAHLDFDAKLGKLQARIDREGLTVLDDLPRSGALLSALGIVEKDHVGEECHAHVISGDRDWGRAPTLVGVCMRPNRHRVEGPSTVKAPHRPGKTQQEREGARAKRDAAAARADAMAAALKTRIGKGDCYDLILRAFLDGTSHDIATSVCRLLDVEGRTTGGIADPVGDLGRFAAKSEPNRLRAAVAVAMVRHEQRFQQWGSTETSTAWLEWLAARGFTPSEWDHNHVAANKKR